MENLVDQLRSEAELVARIAARAKPRTFRENTTLALMRGGTPAPTIDALLAYWGRLSDGITFETGERHVSFQWHGPELR